MNWDKKINEIKEQYEDLSDESKLEILEALKTWMIAELLLLQKKINTEP